MTWDTFYVTSQTLSVLTFMRIRHLVTFRGTFDGISRSGNPFLFMFCKACNLQADHKHTSRSPKISESNQSLKYLALYWIYSLSLDLFLFYLIFISNLSIEIKNMLQLLLVTVGQETRYKTPPGNKPGGGCWLSSNPALSLKASPSPNTLFVGCLTHTLLLST